MAYTYIVRLFLQRVMDFSETFRAENSCNGIYPALFFEGVV